MWGQLKTSFPWVPTSCECKKFKQVWLQHVVLRCPHHLQVEPIIQVWLQHVVLRCPHHLRVEPIIHIYIYKTVNDIHGSLPPSQNVGTKSRKQPPMNSQLLYDLSLRSSQILLILFNFGRTRIIINATRSARPTGRIQMGIRTLVPGKILWPHDQ